VACEFAKWRRRARHARRGVEHRRPSPAHSERAQPGPHASCRAGWKITDGAAAAAACGVATSAKREHEAREAPGARDRYSCPTRRPEQPARRPGEDRRLLPALRGWRARAGGRPRLNRTRLARGHRLAVNREGRREDVAGTLPASTRSAAPRWSGCASCARRIPRSACTLRHFLHRFPAAALRLCASRRPLHPDLVATPLLEVPRALRARSGPPRRRAPIVVHLHGGRERPMDRRARGSSASPAVARRGDRGLAARRGLRARLPSSRGAASSRFERHRSG